MYYIVDARMDSELICSRLLKALQFIPLIHKLSNIIKIKNKMQQSISWIGL